MLKKIYNLIFKRYYVVFVCIYYIVVNTFLTNLIVSGIVYNLYLILFILITIVIIVKYNDTLRFKWIVYPISLIYMLSAKNIFYATLLIVIFVLITSLNIVKDKVVRFLSVLSMIIVVLFSPFILFIIIFGAASNTGIYEDTHYYCDEYEIYMWSGGAYDSFHYTVLKKQDVIEFQNILKIRYNEYISEERSDYEDIQNNKNCRLVGEE